MSKREPEGSMVIEIEGQKIDVGIYLDTDCKGVKYELTSEKEIDPVQTAFVLMLIAKGICNEAGVEPDVIMQEFLGLPDDNSGFH